MQAEQARACAYCCRASSRGRSRQQFASFVLCMIRADSDIQGAVVVLDLEWIGNSMAPHMTHVTELACINSATKVIFHRELMSLSSKSGTNVTHACSPKKVYADFIAWLALQHSDRVYIAAHNGIRYDAPVLRNAMLTYGVAIPNNVYFVDTLYHVRYHLPRLNIKVSGYSIDKIAELCNLVVLPENRHTAIYDACLLCDILQHLQCTYGVPLISGTVQPLHTLGTVLVHGIGPKVSHTIPYGGLLELCEAIIVQHGSLSYRACLVFLEQLKLLEHVPMCNIDLIARNIQPAAERYLQYIE